MSRCRLPDVVLCAVAVMVGIPTVRSEEKAEPASTNPLLILHGRNSKVKKPKLLRITTIEEWWALWMEHKTGSPKPKDLPGDLEHAELDFDKVMAVAVFEGESINCRGFTSHSISEIDGRIHIRIKAHTYQSGFNTPETQAWGILILPRCNKEVVLEHDIRGLINDPPKWAEWTRFPELPEKKR